MNIQTSQEELEIAVGEFEGQGISYLPITEKRREGMIQTPSGRVFTLSFLERIAKRKQRFRFGDKKQIEKTRALAYLNALYQTFPNIQDGLY